MPFRSSASSLEYLRLNSTIPFDSEPTEKFLEAGDEAFDIMNSRNIRNYGTKAPLTPQNATAKLERFSNISDYLSRLKFTDGKLVVKSGRKFAVLGFMIDAQSLRGLYITYLQNLDVFLTYQLSQDPLELLFNIIRRRGGWNNNPSALHLQGAFRSVLLGAGCHSANRGNVLPLDDTPLVDVQREDAEEQFDPCLSEKWGLHEYIQDVITYIAGWVIRKFKERVSCQACIDSLVESSQAVRPSSLLNIKNRGGLIIPSRDLVALLMFCETRFRRNDSFVQISRAATETYGRIGTLFLSGIDHFETTCHGISSHYSNLITFCVETFLHLRFHHKARCDNESGDMKSRRKKLSKLVLFQHN